MRKVRKSDFRILRGWEVTLNGRAMYKGQSCVSHDPKAPKRATIYLWPADSPEPDDFRLHEFLHIALAALDRMPREKQRVAEEELVQDICRIYRREACGKDC